MPAANPIAMKRLRIILIALAALLVLVAAVGLKHVPAGYEAVKVARDGSVHVVSSGWGFAGPGTRLIRYPIGEHALRAPESGAEPVMFEDGDSVAVAFRFDLTIPAGASEVMYRRFSQDFAPAFRRLVIADAEIEAAAIPRPADPRAYESSVVARVGHDLASLGITVRAGTLARFGDRTLGNDTGTTASGGAPRRLIIVGIDGGDWQNLRPLMDAGKLPNFTRLSADGATGPLRSQEPMLSPLLWTTMATGREPEDHGVLNFTVADPKTGVRVPISRLYRKVDAFWNMLGDYDRSVAVIGWLASDPAEEVNGVVVTDKFGYVAYAPEDTARADSGSVYPPSRRDEFSKLAVHGDQVSDDEVLRFVSIPPSEVARHRGDFDAKDPVNGLIHLYASTLTYRNIARYELEHDRPDVLAVYFEWVDAISHLFMLHAPPRMPDVPEDEYERYNGVIEQAYILQDEILGQIMDEMDDRTVLMVVSDHGFKSGSSRLHNRPEIWAGNAAKWHRIDGIVGFYGAGVRHGVTIEGASILDVAPTVLALMGLPHAADMPGSPIASAFDAGVVASFNTQQVKTLDRPREQPATASGGAASEETMKKLEALGYLAPENADAHNNLGQRYQQRGEYQKAIEEYQQAIAMRPNFHAAYNNLAVCYGKLKMYPEAEESLQKCIAINPKDFYAMNNLAVMYMHTGRMDDGLRMAEKAVATEPGYANGRVTLGSVYAMQRRLDDAEAQFREALRLDPENTAAQTNLEKLQALRGSR